MIIGILLALVCFIVVTIYFPKKKERMYAYGNLGYLVILFGSGLAKDLYDAAKNVAIDHNINITVTTPKFYIAVAIGIVWLSIWSHIQKRL